MTKKEIKIALLRSVGPILLTTGVLIVLTATLNRSESEIIYTQDQIMKIITDHEGVEGQTLDLLYSEFCEKYPDGAQATTRYGSQRVFCHGRVVYQEKQFGGF